MISSSRTTMTSHLLVILISVTIAVGTLAASFDSLQPSFSSSSSLSRGGSYQHGKRTRSVDAQPVQLCGFRLLEAVRGLCGGFSHTRRSDPGMSLGGMLEEMAMREPVSNSIDMNSDSTPQYANDAYVDNTQSDYPDMDNNWNRNPKALALKVLAEGKGHQRYRRNIIDECCKRPCTFTHMLKYCGRT